MVNGLRFQVARLRGGRLGSAFFEVISRLISRLAQCFSRQLGRFIAALAELPPAPARSDAAGQRRS